MSIMRETCCKGWSIIESEGWFAFGEFKLFVESVNFFPICKNAFFFSGEIGPFRHYRNLALDYGQKVKYIPVANLEFMCKSVKMCFA